MGYFGIILNGLNRQLCLMMTLLVNNHVNWTIGNSMNSMNNVNLIDSQSIRYCLHDGVWRCWNVVTVSDWCRCGKRLDRVEPLLLRSNIFDGIINSFSNMKLLFLGCQSKNSYKSLKNVESFVNLLKEIFFT